MGMDEVWEEYNELKAILPILNKKVSELEAVNSSLSAKCQMMQQEISLLKMQSSVQSGSQITQWEYTVVESPEYHLNDLNKLGKEGWEATGNTSNGSSILLKRPIPKRL